MAEPDRPKPHHYSPDFEKEGGDPEWFRAGELIREVSSLRLDYPESAQDETSSDDLQDNLDALADEYDRAAIQISAIPVQDTIEDDVRFILTQELRNAADLLRDGASDTVGTSWEEYISAVIDTTPYIEEAIIILNAIKITHGAKLPSNGAFLNTRGEFGFSYRNEFQAAPLAVELESCCDDLKGAFVSDYMTEGEVRETAILVGRRILKVLSTILKGLSKTTDDPLERLFRFITVKLEAMLGIISNEYSLPPRTFKSKIFERVREEEKRGTYALSRIYQPKLIKHITSTSELEDAVALMQYAKSIADAKNRTS